MYGGSGSNFTDLMAATKKLSMLLGIQPVNPEPLGNINPNPS
jgi:hypothetical protein